MTEAHQFLTTKQSGDSTLSFVERVPATTTSTSIDLGTLLPTIDAATMVCARAIEHVT